MFTSQTCLKKPLPDTLFKMIPEHRMLNTWWLQAFPLFSSPRQQWHDCHQALHWLISFHHLRNIRNGWIVNTLGLQNFYILWATKLEKNTTDTIMWIYLRNPQHRHPSHVVPLVWLMFPSSQHPIREWQGRVQPDKLQMHCDQLKQLFPHNFQQLVIHSSNLESYGRDKCYYLIFPLSWHLKEKEVDSESRRPRIPGSYNYYPYPHLELVEITSS